MTLEHKITSILIAIVLMAGMFYVTDQHIFAHKLITDVALSYDNPTPVDGQTVEIKGTVTTSNTPAGPGVGNPSHGSIIVNAGTGKIQQGNDLDGNPASDCASVVSWTDKSSSTPINGDFAYSLDTTGLGGQTLVFRALYITSSDPHGAATTPGICTPLAIDNAVPPTEDCTGDLEIAASDTSAGNPNYSYTITIKACVALTDVSLQGGSNGWSTQTGVAVSTGDYTTKTLKKNTVTTWTIGDMEEGQTETLTVSLNGNVKCPKTVNLNGAWSAKYIIDDEDDDDPVLKSDYTTPLTTTCE